MVRIRGAESGEHWLWLQGTVFGREPDDVMREHFGFTSVLRMRYQRDGDRGWRFEQRESAHFHDLASGRVLREWSNPYTGVVNIPVGYVSPRFRLRVDSEGIYAGDEATRPSGRVASGLETDGRDIWITEVRDNSYDTGLRRREFPEAYASEVRRSRDVATYRSPLQQALDDADALLPASMSFVADLPWLQWMLMGRHPGHVIWYGQGAKAARVDQLPGELARRVASVHPGFLEDPWGIDGTPYGTLYQMRQLRKEGRI